MLQGTEYVCLVRFITMIGDYISELEDSSLP